MIQARPSTTSYYVGNELIFVCEMEKGTYVLFETIVMHEALVKSLWEAKLNGENPIDYYDIVKPILCSNARKYIQFYLAMQQSFYPCS